MWTVLLTTAWKKCSIRLEKTVMMDYCQDGDTVRMETSTQMITTAPQ